MNNKLKFFIITAIASIVIAPQVYSEAVLQQNNVVKTAQQVQNYTGSLDMVANPSKYLNKNVTVKGKFDKFSPKFVKKYTNQLNSQIVHRKFSKITPNRCI